MLQSTQETFINLLGAWLALSSASVLELLLVVLLL